MVTQRVLVTGATGYIGLWLCRLLRQEGYSVVAFDKGLFPSGVAAIDTFAPGCELVLGDLRDMDVALFDGVDYVCHLGGLSNDPTADFSPELNWSLNVAATEHVVDLAKSVGVRRLTFASSASVYGLSFDRALTEDCEVNPQSVYAESKLAAEKLVLGCDEIGPMVLRQATVGGWSPRLRTDLVVNTMTLCALRDGVIKVYGGGEAYRPLISVADVAEVHVRLLDQGDSGEIYNVAHRRQLSEQGTEGYTMACLALWISKIISDAGFPNVVKGDWDNMEGRSYDMSCAKLRRTLDWEPQQSMKDVVLELIGHKDDLLSAGNEARNINWMEMAHHIEEINQRDGKVWGLTK